MVSHLVYRVAPRIDQAQELALIAQLAFEGADDRQGSPVRAGRLVRVSQAGGIRGDGDVGAGREHGPFLEGIGDAPVEAEAADVDVLRGAVEELDKGGQLTSAGWMVHDLVDHDVTLERDGVRGAGCGGRRNHEATAGVRVEGVTGAIKRRGDLGRIVEGGGGEHLAQVGTAQKDGDALRRQVEGHL